MDVRREFTLQKLFITTGGFGDEKKTKQNKAPHPKTPFCATLPCASTYFMTSNY